MEGPGYGNIPKSLFGSFFFIIYLFSLFRPFKNFFVACVSKGDRHRSKRWKRETKYEMIISSSPFSSPHLLKGIKKKENWSVV